MDRTKKYLITAFISVLIIVAIISILGMILLKDKPTILQGQIEATEIRISGTDRYILSQRRSKRLCR